MIPSTPEQSELGKKSAYETAYNPQLLFPLPREPKRIEIGLKDKPIPFFGFDQWNHYEVSWLNEKGKPIAALAEISYDCQTPFIIESKSMKLYFNSFNQTKIKDVATLENIIRADLTNCLQGEATVSITPLCQAKEIHLLPHFSGICLDEQDIDCTTYTVTPSLLTTTDAIVEETLHSNLLKSNCLVTYQPDWGSVQIHYKGKQINHANLLRYLVSFRNHNEFHEQCIERIFVDIMQYCQPEELTVYGRYTRRGGLDINPYRSSVKQTPNFIQPRLIRQ